jgi:hypothetical protein
MKALHPSTANAQKAQYVFLLHKYVYLLHKSLYGMIQSPRYVHYLLHKSLYGIIQSPQAWYQLWCTICTLFGLQKLVTDGCVHIKYVNNKKTTHQQPKINLNDLSRDLKHLPLHDHIYLDCPHDTSIIIVVTYVDDKLVFTNCETMCLQFAAHCIQNVRFNDEEPTRWYLGTQYDRDPISGAVKTRAVHQQAPGTLANVRLQSDQDTLLRQAG